MSTLQSLYNNKSGTEGVKVGRTLLTEDKIYYVRSDGNDLNSGTSNSAEGAFATWQAAIDYVSSLDLGVYNVTIKAGLAETWDLGANTIELKDPVGSGLVTIQGFSSTASDSTFQNDGSRYLFKGERVKKIVLKDFKVRVINLGRIFIDNSFVQIDNLSFVLDPSTPVGPTGIQAHNQAICKIISGITIEGNFSYFFNLGYGSVLDYFVPNEETRTLTLVGNPVWGTCFILGRLGSIADFAGLGVTITGSASGPRVNLDQNCSVRDRTIYKIPGSTNGIVSGNSTYSDY
jgi:hypothetical protein